VEVLPPKVPPVHQSIPPVPEAAPWPPNPDGIGSRVIEGSLCRHGDTAMVVDLRLVDAGTATIAASGLYRLVAA